MAKKRRKRSRQGRRSSGASAESRDLQQSAGASSSVSFEQWTAEIREAHEQHAWGKVIDSWRRMDGTPPPQEPQNQDGEAGVAEILPLVTEAFFQHGLNLRRRQNNLAAIEHFREAARLAPDDQRYRYELALTHHRNGDWDEAIATYWQILQQDERHERAAYHLCLACLQSGRGLEKGGLFNAAMRILAGEQADDKSALPWYLRRLLAWREYMLTGSTASLTDVFADKRGQKSSLRSHAADAYHQGTEVLSLEEALATAAAGKVEAGRRRIKGRKWATDLTFIVLSLSVQALLAARAGHHRRAGSLAMKAVETLEEIDIEQMPPLRAFVVRVLWEAGLALWWKQARSEAAPLWEEALKLDPESRLLRHNVALAREEAEADTGGEEWEVLLRPWDLKWRRGGKWVRPEAALAYSMMVRRAVEGALEEEDYRRARRLLRRAQKLVPDDPELRVSQLLVSLAEGGPQTNKVRELLADVVACLAEDLERLTSIGHMCMAFDLSPEETVELWEHIYEKDPDHACAAVHLSEVYEKRGETAWQHGDPDEALAQFERALELDPERTSVYIWLGGLYLLQGDASRAQEFLKKVDDDPSSEVAYAWVEAGGQLLLAGMSQEAEQFFERAQSLEDHMPEVRLGIGLKLVAAGKEKAALAHFFAACRNSGYEAGMVYTAAAALAEAEAYSQAIELLDEVLPYHPDDLALWMWRAIAEFFEKGLAADRSIIQRARILAVHVGDTQTMRSMDRLLEVIDSGSYPE